MVLKRRVALNSVQLDSVDDRIMISGVVTGDGKENIQTVSLWGDSAGSRVTSMHRDSLDITVKFRVRLKKRSMADREEVVEKVNSWASAGGTLTTNYKTGRYISVFLAQAAAVGDPWEWTKEYSLVFRACGVPYWQSYMSQRVQNTNSYSTSFTVKGSVRSVMNVTFKNTSGETCDTITVSIGESSMSFSNLGLADNETFYIDHIDNGKRCLLTIRIKDTDGVYRSAMNKRSASSSDDLYATPGSKTFSFSAGKFGNLTFTNWGRFA